MVIKNRTSILFALCLSIFFWGCDKINVDNELIDDRGFTAMSYTDLAQDPTGIDDICSDMRTIEFIAGQHEHVGVIDIYNDEEFLYFHIIMEDGWVLTESHLFLGEELPKNLSPGKFLNKEDHGDGVEDFWYVFEIDEITTDCVSAIHGVVKFDDTDAGEGGIGDEGGLGLGNGGMFGGTPTGMIDEEEDFIGGMREETAWGEGLDFGKGWSMYQIIEIANCEIER